MGSLGAKSGARQKLVAQAKRSGQGAHSGRKHSPMSVGASERTHLRSWHTPDRHCQAKKHERQSGLLIVGLGSCATHRESRVASRRSGRREAIWKGRSTGEGLGKLLAKVERAVEDCLGDRAY